MERQVTKTAGVHDLIDRETLKKRVRSTHALMEGDRWAHHRALERITLFTTFRCNMACPYCQTIRHNPPDPETEFTLDGLCRLLDTYAPTPIRHIHFTGGEATLNPDLAAMVNESARRGITSSLTTNGLAPFSLYERLMNEGLCEIRISCDGTDSQSKRTVPDYRDQTFQETVIERIRALVRLKERRKQPFSIIVNSCVSYDNRIAMAEQVAALMALNPDDIKLIPISYESPSLGNFQERHAVVRAIETRLTRLPPERFPLLRSKLATVFAPDTWGFRDWTGAHLMRHCYLPLTERTITSKGYYPCPVYVREGGPPLGPLTDGREVQHQTIAAFAQGESCREDPICLDNCVNCLKRFNLLANAVIGRSALGKSGNREPITHLIETEDAERVTAKEVWDRMAEIKKAKTSGNGNIDAPHPQFSHDMETATPPFLVIKPGGMAYREEIFRFLKNEGIRIVQIIPISNWNRIATGLYATIGLNGTAQYQRIAYGILLEKVLPTIEGRSDGLLLILDLDLDLDWLKRIKQCLRRFLPPSNVVIHHHNGVLMTSQGFVHTPDKTKHREEMNYLCNRSN